MSDDITNQAAWQTAPGQKLQLGSTDLPVPAANEILIRNAAIAINPLDWLLQDFALLPWLSYPAILGSDVAGTIVAVGSDVERLKVGDRVLGQAVGTTVNEKAQGAFQQHTIVLEHMASPIPDQMAFSDAAVLPLGLGTAASGLYEAVGAGAAIAFAHCQGRGRPNLGRIVQCRVQCHPARGGFRVHGCHHRIRSKRRDAEVARRKCCTRPYKRDRRR
jgi:NADPH:quinone reductase-like Zn-dependent oxidoreductase